MRARVQSLARERCHSNQLQSVNAIAIVYDSAYERLMRDAGQDAPNQYSRQAGLKGEVELGTS